MQISSIILFMIDLYKDNHVRACVCAFVNFFFFKKKTFPQKLLTGLLPNFVVVFLRSGLKYSLHRYRKIRPVKQYRRSSASSFKLYQSKNLFFGKGLKNHLKRLDRVAKDTKIQLYCNPLLFDKTILMME